MSPRAGFAEVFRASRQRAAAGAKPVGGFAPYVLAGLGGAALMLLWLKLGSMLGVRDVASSEFRWSYLAVAGAAGALLGILAQSIWGLVGALVTRSLGSASPARDLRVVWGASAFPQILGLAILLPLDLAIVGTDTFTTEQLDGSLTTAWAAISIALSLSLAAWSLFIFVRGVEVAASVSMPRALAITALGAACLAAIVGGSVLGAASISGGA